MNAKTIINGDGIRVFKNDWFYIPGIDNGYMEE